MAHGPPLLPPNPTAGRARELFPTIGAVVAFYLAGHVLNHLGQLSTWRRCIGLPRRHSAGTGGQRWGPGPVGTL